jgi:hypothetical protein
MDIGRIASGIILGQKASDHDKEMLIDFILDHINPDLETDEADKFEKMPRLAAELVLRKITGDKDESSQNIARRYLAREKPAPEPTWKPLRPTQQLRDNTPHRILFKTGTVPRVSNDLFGLHQVYVPAELFDRIFRNDPDAIVELDGNEMIYARIQGPSDDFEVSSEIKSRLGKGPVNVRILADLAEIEFIEFSILQTPDFLEKNRDAIQEDIETSLVGCPVVFIGQELGKYKVRVRHLRPEYAFCKTPFDAQVSYGISVETIGMRIAARAICESCKSSEVTGVCSACMVHAFCSDKCAKEHFIENKCGLEYQSSQRPHH